MPVDAEVMDERWSPSLYPKQVEVLAACGPSKQNLILVNGPRWASKCVHPDTLVFTERGAVPIGSLGSADEDCFSAINAIVLSMHADGDFKMSKATQFYNSGVKDALMFVSAGRREIVCSLVHPLWVICDGVVGYRTANKIRSLMMEGKEVLAPCLRQFEDSDLTVWWDRILDFTETKCALVDISVPETHNFIGNGFINHNTFACQHAVCQHGWNTDRGNICLLTITQSVGVDSGVWQHLTEIFIPEWIKGGFGMKWVKEPYTQAITKKPACEINNVYGNKTRISLESLRNEDEVEARFKGKEYSMIWVNELSKFKKRKTFDTLKQCLRMPHLSTEQHLFLADTNPDLDLGVLSWIYMLWYEFRTADEEVLAKLYPNWEAEKLRPLQRALRLIEFSVDDNWSLSDEKKGELFADFASDPDLMAAYYYGKWVTASADALFYKVFQPNLHVIGEVETASNSEPLTMVPEENCAELILGIDPGVTNCAAAIMEKAFRVDTAKDGAKQQVPVIKILDEMVIVGEDFSLLDYVEQLVEKMDFWERLAGRPGKILWRQWSDRSVFDMRVPFTDRLWHEHIYTASGGKIALNAANRGPGTVQPRVDLFRKLLYDHRLFISKRYCPQTIEMCKSLKKGSRQGEHVQRASRHKHIFDAITYAAASELSDELSREIALIMREMRNPKKESTIVSVRM